MGRLGIPLGANNQPPMQLAQPFNDAQLIALVAAQTGLVDHRNAVRVAMEIVATTIVMMQGNALPELIQKKMRERDAELASN